MVAKPKSRQSQWRSGAAYSKSTQTRKAILRAAIEAFGKAGYSAVSTRQIAAAAQVNQPAISYYFGSKEGLYLACAEEILSGFTEPLTQLSQQVVEDLNTGLAPQGAAEQLKALLSALADVMILSEEVSEAAGFVGREMREPGLAYQHLYNNLWSPGIELSARLVATVKGRRSANAADRVDAIMMISGIAAFTPGLSVSMEVMRWKKAGAEGKALVMDRLAAQIDAMLDE